MGLPIGMLPVLVTDVRLDEDVTPFERAALRARDRKPPTSLPGLLDPDSAGEWEPGGPHDFVVLAAPLDPTCIPGARTYMPFILYHYIECTWGPCYSSLFAHVIRPHLASVEVLEYVLRSPVVRDDMSEANRPDEPRMYRELYHQLRQVRSATVRRYVTETFSRRDTPRT